MTRTLVCFGDSNTWGYDPETGDRLPREVRWPVRLGRALGEEWEVIAEGLNGRLATIESPIAEGRNGLPYLVPCLRSHMPVDLLVIYLGTNDASWLPAEQVAGVGRPTRQGRPRVRGRAVTGSPRDTRRLSAAVHRLRARPCLRGGLRAARL